MREQNLEIIKRDDHTFALTFTDNLGVIDITQWTVNFIIKGQKSSIPIIDKGITEHVDPTHGITKIILTNKETDIKAGDYKYSLKIRTGADEVYTILAGIIKVKEV